MKNSLILFYIFLLSTSVAMGQEVKQKHRLPIWTFHQRNVTVHGVSVGLGSWQPNESWHTNTNGVKIELIGIGVLSPLIPSSPVSQSQEYFEYEMAQGFSERINGLNLSASGSSCQCLTNGVAAGIVGQYHTQINGISVAWLLNTAEIHNGVQLAFLMNESYQMNGLQIAATTISHKTKGVQIGLLNHSISLKGVQIGLWNKNQKRSLPIINWSFKD